MDMHAKVASTVLLALGAADLTTLNLLLVPHLRDGIAAPIVAAEQRDDPQLVPRREPARAADRPGDDERAAVSAASSNLAPRAPARPERAAADIRFGFDSVRIEQRPAFDDLRRVLQELSEDPRRALLIRGHSDPLGTPAHNLDLSRRRAAAVRQYLVWRGASPDRITIEALGDAEPAEGAGDGGPARRGPAAWARDRRVELLWR
jgi:outer membrane protein OmpA-like peptidoglycan-associated protein